MTTRPVSSLTGVMLLVSRIACLIVVASLVVFAVNKTKTASAHQQGMVTGSLRQSEGEADNGHQSALHRKLDEISNTLTSPFASAVEGSTSEWKIHLVKTALALLVYGLGVGFLVRFIRLRQ
jgi:hypothetical protein